MDGWSDGWMDGWMVGWIGGWWMREGGGGLMSGYLLNSLQCLSY